MEEEKMSGNDDNSLHICAKSFSVGMMLVCVCFVREKWSFFYIVKQMLNFGLGLCNE